MNALLNTNLDSIFKMSIDTGIVKTASTWIDCKVRGEKQPTLLVEVVKNSRGEWIAKDKEYQPYVTGGVVVFSHF